MLLLCRNSRGPSIASEIEKKISLLLLEVAKGILTLGKKFLRVIYS